VHKFEKAIKVNGPDSDLPASDSKVIDESTDDGKKKSATKKRNAIAMVHLSDGIYKRSHDAIDLQGKEPGMARRTGTQSIQGTIQEIQAH
jgi:hypothetical protein